MKFGPGVANFTYRGRGYMFRSPERDHIGKVQGASKTFYEIDLLEAIEVALAQRGEEGIAVDVGAHIGNHTVFFASVLGMPTIAFEPNPAVFELLRKNTRIGDSASIVPLPMAAGAIAGWGDVVAGPKGNTGMAGVRAGIEGDLLIVAVDDIVPDWTRVALLKVDVEGMELEVLEGAATIIGTQQPVITLEARTEADFEAHREFFSDYGYEPSRRYCKTPTYIWMPPAVPASPRILV